MSPKQSRQFTNFHLQIIGHIWLTEKFVFTIDMFQQVRFHDAKKQKWQLYSVHGIIFLLVILRLHVRLGWLWADLHSGTLSWNSCTCSVDAISKSDVFLRYLKHCPKQSYSTTWHKADPVSVKSYAVPGALSLSLIRNAPSCDCFISFSSACCLVTLPWNQLKFNNDEKRNNIVG